MRNEEEGRRIGGWGVDLAGGGLVGGLSKGKDELREWVQEICNQ